MDHKFHNDKAILFNVTETDQKFQFYQCDVPSEEYEGSQDHKKFGQLRSVQDPSQCLTLGGIYVMPKDSDSIEDVLIKTDYVDTAFVLRPCLDKGEDLRRQWLSAYRVGDCGIRLTLEGKKSDVSADNHARWLLVDPL